MSARFSPPEGFVRVRFLAWRDLELMSDVLRRVGHDLNNALAPVFGLLDLMRSRHDMTTATADMDGLSKRVLALRDVGAHTVRQTLRTQHQQAPTMTDIHASQASAAIAAKIALRWRADPGPASPMPLGLDGHQAALLLRCLIANAHDAYAGDSRDEAKVPPQVMVQFDSDEQGTLRGMSIADEGPGCADLQAAADGALHRHGKGHLGTGLIIAASLVERGHGALYIGDRPGGGFEARALWPRALVHARA